MENNESGPIMESETVEKVEIVNTPPPADVPEPVETPVQPTAPADNPMAPVATKKKGKGMIYGMICLALLAIAGIAFGVYMMIDKETAVKDLNSQIDTLKSQNNDLRDQVLELESTIEEQAEVEVEVDCVATPDAEGCVETSTETETTTNPATESTTNSTTDSATEEIVTE